MFEAIKIYKSEKLNAEELFPMLHSYGYERTGRVSAAGDFDRRGEIISIFPITFSDPIRLELKGDTIDRIRSYDIGSGRPLEEHEMAIILPIKGLYRKKIKTAGAGIAERSPIDSFVDIEAGDK